MGSSGPAGLAEYRRKRDFRRTAEPRGTRVAAKTAHGIYVVQRHEARNLHFDLRLEHRGVLLSWAVPKGPGTAPGERRLAVRVEDHPLEYARFEGRIPEGEYGAGEVRLWDRGSWRPEGDVDRALARGRLDFRLEGGRLAGSWHLVRFAGKEASTARSRRDWLLIRGRDQPTVESRSQLDESPAPGDLRRLADEFALAKLVDRPPAGRDWVHETKWDGYRMLAVRSGDAFSLVSRSGADWSARLPEIVDALGALDSPRFVLDGEVVSLKRRKSSFGELQAALAAPAGSRSRSRLVFMAFDLLLWGDEDLRSRPLVERKRRLAAVVEGAASARLLFSRHRTGGGGTQLDRACERELEGLVSKRANAPYRSGRTGDWLKSKCRPRQEFVVVGWVPARGGGDESEIGSLLLATAGSEAGDSLRYVGRVGTGFDRSTRAELAARLPALAARAAALEVPRPAARGARWLRPRLVAEVAFADWTGDGLLRQASFLGLREDKAPADVVREEADASPRVDRDSVAGVRITHPDRRLFPDAPFTKHDLARYFEDVWPWLEPHLADRPLAFLRCPAGARAECFFQKHWVGELPGTAPVSIEGRDGPESYLRVEGREGLVGLAQYGVIELHLWGSRADRLERPDRLVFDLDPGPRVTWRDVIRGARRLRELLARLGLESFAMTSGGKGLHVVVPLVPGPEWPAVRAAAAAVARALAEHDPALFVHRAAKSARTGRIFVDYLRNGRGATAISPFSPRARAGAPVAMPIRWSELARAAPARWTLRNAAARLRRLARDPWQGYFDLRQRLPPVLVGENRRENAEGRLDMATPKKATGSKPRKKTRKRAPSAQSTRKATRSRKTSKRRYGEKASEKVGEAIGEMKRGKLRSGASGKKVTSRKQAIAIGLSEARRAGGKVPDARDDD